MDQINNKPEEKKEEKKNVSAKTKKILKKTGTILGVLTVGVLAGFAGGYYYHSKKSSSKKTIKPADDPIARVIVRGTFSDFDTKRKYNNPLEDLTQNTFKKNPYSRFSKFK